MKYPARCSSTYGLAMVLLTGCLLLPGPGSLLQPARAQETDYDPSWYLPDRSYVKIAVVQDGVHRISGGDLSRLGLPLSGIAPGTLQLFENGTEIPLWYTGDAQGLNNDAQIYFVGRRNRGTEEAWAYRGNADWQGSTFYSLYTDTTYYWLMWGRTPGLRYRTSPNAAQPFPEVTTLRDTLHLESDGPYYDGDGNDAENPFYTRGEGYYQHNLFHSGSTSPVVLNLSTGSLGGAPASADTLYLRVSLYGYTASRHRVTLDLETAQGGSTAFRPFDEADWVGYGFETLRAAIPQTEIPPGRVMGVRITSHNEFAAPANGVFVDWMEVSYVREMTAQNGVFRAHFPTPAARRIVIGGFPNTPVLVFSPGDLRLFETTPEAGRITLYHASEAPPVYWATTLDALRPPAALALDRPSDWASPANRADYLILTTRALRASANALADYRRIHNGFRVEVVDVQDVYDQFDYGRPTPRAIRRFVHQTQRWQTTPRFLTVWGDALYANRTRPRPAWEVPSYGKASSDGWFAMQYGGPNDWTEVLAVGRLPIRDDAQGLLFLQKLQSYESAPLEDWEKNMLMLVGGRGTSEQLTLQSFVTPWIDRAVAAPTGMKTANFFRDTDTPVDPSFQDSLRASLRAGASWLSYFGHSAAVTWEIVTDEPEDFNNAARLPVAISLGCRTGAFAGGLHANENVPVLAEKMIIGSLNGAIAHWGTSGLGTISASARMGTSLHELVFTDTLRTLGVIFQQVKRQYATSGAFSLRDLAQFGLIGEPATRLVIPIRPDFHLSQAQIRITPVAPIPADSQLTVAVTLKNRGLVPADSVTLDLVHTPPDGRSASYRARVAPFTLEQDVRFAVPIGEAMVGDNRFLAVIDPEDEYAEAVELNNTAERTIVVFSSQLTLIAPRNLSGVPSGPLRFRVSLTIEGEEEVPIVFELDEVPAFDSPSLRTYTTASTGAFALWPLGEALQPGRPYYWRARTNAPGDPVNWQQAAFYVLPGDDPTAWLQTGALFDFSTRDARLRRENGRWAFGTYNVEISAESVGPGGSIPGRFVVDGNDYGVLNLGFSLMTLDGDNGRIRAHGNAIPYPNPFVDHQRERARLDSLARLPRPGDYVFVRTRHFANRGPAEISDDVKAVFRSLGSTMIDTLTYGHIWIMRTRVGHPEETREWAVRLTPDVTQLIHNELLFFPEPEGVTWSPQVGPARDWRSLDWEAALPNASSQVRVEVLDAGTDAVLLGGLTTPGPTDLSGIDARQHPYLRLRATLSDSAQQATPQLLRWSLQFTAVPEVAIDPSSLTLSADTLQESEPLDFSALVYNLSDDPADSVLVTLQLTDAANRTTLAGTKTLAELPADASVTAAFSLETEGLLGSNMLTIKAEQPGLREPLTFNNTAITTFSVRGDRQPPTLRVTVNGEALPHDPEPVRDLQSLEIPQVPARSTIEIVFSDDNTYKLLTDSSLATITLNDQRIAFSRPDVQFVPATAARNEARIVFTPDFSGQNAVYTLRVRVFDVSGNEAEGSPYQVHFRVQTSFEVGSVYPYPNPMGSFTRFAFLLKGADTSLIDDFRIRVYTINGRVVREFDLVQNPDLLGDGLRIGWNKLYWDVRDEDGDLLGPGVYLYKVFLKVEGQTINVNNDKSIEKLVVLR